MILAPPVEARELVGDEFPTCIGEGVGLAPVLVPVLYEKIATLLVTVTVVSVTAAWRITTARKAEQREAYYSNIALAAGSN